MDLTDVTIPEKVSTEIEQEVERWNSEYCIVELMGRRMGTRYRVNLKIRIEPYIKAIDGVTDLRALEKRLLRKIPALQGVDIKGDVDSKRVEFSTKTDLKSMSGRLLRNIQTGTTPSIRLNFISCRTRLKPILT